MNILLPVCNFTECAFDV